MCVQHRWVCLALLSWLKDAAPQSKLGIVGKWRGERSALSRSSRIQQDPAAAASISEKGKTKGFKRAGRCSFWSLKQSWKELNNGCLATEGGCLHGELYFNFKVINNRFLWRYWCLWDYGIGLLICQQSGKSREYRGNIIYLVPSRSSHRLSPVRALIASLAPFNDGSAVFWVLWWVTAQESQNR